MTLVLAADAGTDHDPDWVTRAACAGIGPDRFFPVDGDWSEAKAICAGCPVAEECLAYALANSIVDGVWGGLTPSQRRHTARVHTKRCAECTTVFHPTRAAALYCSGDCKRTAANRQSHWYVRNAV